MVVPYIHQNREDLGVHRFGRVFRRSAELAELGKVLAVEARPALHRASRVVKSGGFRNRVRVRVAKKVSVKSLITDYFTYTD